MNITDLLNQAGGLQSIARELGIDQDEAARGAGALLPSILGGLQKKQEESRADLGAVLGQAGGGGMLDQVLAPQPTDPSAGNQVLGHIFGSKDVSRGVAQQAAQHTGLSPELLKKMLPLLAMAVSGMLAQRAGAAGGNLGGGLGSVLGNVLGGSLGNVLGGMVGKMGR